MSFTTIIVVAVVFVAYVAVVALLVRRGANRLSRRVTRWERER